jgi:spore germination protein KB
MKVSKLQKKIPKITPYQLSVLLFVFIVGDEIAILPLIQAVEAKQSGWIVGVFSLLVGLCIILFIYYPLSRLYPNKTFVEYSEDILGKWAGKAITLIFVLYSFYYAALSMRYTGDFITSQILPNTPPVAIYILFALITVYGVSLGIDTLAKSFELMYAFVLLAIIILTFAFISVAKGENLAPYFAGGVKSILRGSVTFITMPYMELIFFLMIVPYVTQQERVKKSWIIGTIMGGLFLISFTAMTILVLGVNITTSILYPGWKLGMRVHWGEFFQKIQIGINMLSFFDLYARLVICFYCAYKGIVQLFNLKNAQYFILPLGILLVLLAKLVASDITYLFSLDRYKPFLDIFFAFIPASLMLIIGKIKQRRKCALESN